VVYTVLTGGYETLNELQVIDPTVRAICFTDDPNLKSSTWDVVQIEPIFKSDPIRNQRLIKILGHPVLRQYEEWLYIDNTVRLLKIPSLILDDYLVESDLAIPSHSFRKSVRAEFDVVKVQRLDSATRLNEQLVHYQAHHPSSLEVQPLWNGIIARRPNQDVDKWAEIWASHVLRYSRRDQLSIVVALEETKPKFKRIEIDNHSSDYHEWPIHNQRKVEQRIYTGVKVHKKISQYFRQTYFKSVKKLVNLLHKAKGLF
jgi:hypothetical protein